MAFPLVCKGSHVTDITLIATISTEAILQEEGLVVVFNAGLACRNPAVKGAGGCGILLVYQVGP